VNVYVAVPVDETCRVAAVNAGSRPVPPALPLQFAGVQRAIVCAVPDWLTHVTVPPATTLACAGVKQKYAQFVEMFTTTLCGAAVVWACAAVTGATAMKPLMRPTTAAVVIRLTKAPSTRTGNHTNAARDPFTGFSRVCTQCSGAGKLGVSSAGYLAGVKLEPQSRPRRITLERAFNFRDLGGYAAADGRTVRWGLLYRADGIHRIEGADLARVSALGIRTVLDLRTRSELDDHGRVRTESFDAVYHHLPLLEQVWGRDLPVAEVDAVDFLAGRYFDMLTLGSTSIVTALNTVATADRLPLVFHCSAGKDRTGVLAAILLSVLGVSDDDIASDYALSRAAMRELAEWVRTERPESYETMAAQPPAFLDAPPLAMRRFLALARSEYGSLTDYVTESGVGSDVIESLRVTLLT
jgi:protein-tyrosine phosphatase